MSLVCNQKERSKTKTKSSVNIDKTTQADLAILSTRKGMSKKDIVKNLVSKELRKGGRTH